MKRFQPSYLKKIRENLRMTQAAFATMIAPGLTRQHVHSWEKGIASPSAQNLMAICHALEIDADSLFADG